MQGESAILYFTKQLSELRTWNSILMIFTYVSLLQALADTDDERLVIPSLLNAINEVVAL